MADHLKDEDESALLSQVASAMQENGWLPSASAELPEGIPDPHDVLRSSEAVFTGRTVLSELPPLSLQQPDDTFDVEAALKRAAREAGHLTPQVEQQMRKDKEQAIRKRNDQSES